MTSKEVNNKSKKILFIITQSEIGGAQKYVLEIAAHLDRNKYEIVVAAGPDGKWELLKRLEKSGVKTKKLWFLKRKINPIFDILGLLEIYLFIKRENPDILHLNSSKAGILGSLAAWLSAKLEKSSSSNSRRFLLYSRSLIIYRIGGWAFNDPIPWWQKIIYILVEKLSSQWKDIIIVNSESDKKIALKYRICPEEKIKVIYNGIDADKIDFLPKEKAIRILIKNYKLQITNYKQNTKHKAQTIVIGTIANFYKTKGLEYLIETARVINIKYQISNIKYIIIGDGSQKSKLENLIKKYRLENYLFLVGQIPEASKYLKAFDIFILPSVKEGMPWTILEAMAAGLPIIATNVGGVPETIENGKNGVLVEPKNAKELAKAILKLIKNKSLGNSLAKRAKQTVEEKFGLEKMLSETEGLLRE